jgi:hypothetical protein
VSRPRNENRRDLVPGPVRLGRGVSRKRAWRDAGRGRGGGSLFGDTSGLPRRGRGRRTRTLGMGVLAVFLKMGCLLASHKS